MAASIQAARATKLMVRGIPSLALAKSSPAENHIPGGYLLQQLADQRHPKPRRDKGERARGAVRFLDDSRLETRAPASFQKPIAVIRLQTI